MKDSAGVGIYRMAIGYDFILIFIEIMEMRFTKINVLATPLLNFL